MAKRPLDADALLEQMESMAAQTKEAIDGLQQEIREIEKRAEEEKKPIFDKIRRLNEAYSRMTGKSHLRSESHAAPPSGRSGKRRSSALMQELATQMGNVIKRHRDGILGNDIRKEVDGLEPADNLTLILKKYKIPFSTSGPRRAMLYIPA